MSNSNEKKQQLYVELWNAKPAWLALSEKERSEYFEKVGSEIEKLMKEGIELVGFALNDQETPHRSDYRYIAAWTLPSKDHVDMLEESVYEAGWYRYFDQVNARGELVPPPVALGDMIKLS